MTPQTRRTRTRGARSGVTLIELMITLVVFGIVVAGALQLLDSQGKAVRLGNQKMGALQQIQFSMATLDNQIRLAGGGTVKEQPFLVYAGTDVIAFNADYATNVANDPFAAYYDPDAPNGTVSAMSMAQQIKIPNTNFVYPKQSYAPSPAETIIFFFTPDTGTARTDDAILFRQVNDDPPEVVARNIISNTGTPYFSYVRLVSPKDAAPYTDSVRTKDLPLMHSEPEHLSPTDIGTKAIIDSVRAIRVTLTVTDGNTGAAEQRRTLTHLISMPNAGLVVDRSCGDEPQLATTLQATWAEPTPGDTLVRLVWDPSVDELSGEKDVVRYVVWRKLQSATDWGDPYFSTPGGQDPYIWEDRGLEHGATYVYRVAAQDCSPSYSPFVVSSPVTVP